MDVYLLSLKYANQRHETVAPTPRAVAEGTWFQNLNPNTDPHCQICHPTTMFMWPLLCVQMCGFFFPLSSKTDVLPMKWPNIESTHSIKSFPLNSFINQHCGGLLCNNQENLSVVASLQLNPEPFVFFKSQSCQVGFSLGFVRSCLKLLRIDVRFSDPTQNGYLSWWGLEYKLNMMQKRR